MEPILYIETNFVIGVAKGQDVHGDLFLSGKYPGIRVVFPSICFMEALGVLSFERKQREKFYEEIGKHKRDAKRDQTASHAPTLVSLLDQSLIESGALLNEIEFRLHSMFESLSRNSEWITLDADIIHDYLIPGRLRDSADNLILSNILRHARQHPIEPKAFLSSNSNDFEQPQVAEALEAAGVKYFKRTEAAVGWLQSQVPPGPAQ